MIYVLIVCGSMNFTCYEAQSFDSKAVCEALRDDYNKKYDHWWAVTRTFACDERKKS